MSYIQVKIQVPEAEQDALIARLSDWDPTGFEQQEGSLIAYFMPDPFKAVPVAELLSDHTYTIEELEDQNWNAVWECNFEPVVVEDFCAIRAHFHPPLGTTEYELLITPKMSFGTGHHATTYMMIQQMRALDFRGRSVFDFGTGTGVLAFLAEKRGARQIQAIDNDPWSIENARENAINNQCHRTTLFLSESVPEGPFDIILANINRNVLLEHMGALAQTLNPGGALLLSGLLEADGPDIEAAARKQELALKKRLMRNGWISLLFVN